MVNKKKDNWPRKIKEKQSNYEWRYLLTVLQDLLFILSTTVPGTVNENGSVPKQQCSGFDVGMS
jgi:hypothetical protein